MQNSRFFILLCSCSLAASVSLCGGAQNVNGVPADRAPLVALNEASSVPSFALANATASASLANLTELPEAPQDQKQTPEQAATTAPHQDGQTKRILGIIPNFRAVSADVKLPPQSVKEKFVTATQDSFDYSTIFLPAVLAGYGQITNATPEFHGGAVAYGRYFWHSYVDQTSENYFVEFLGPVLFKQDSRYYTMSKGGFRKRAVYSLTRAIITRNDAGKNVFNASEVLGAGAAAGVSNLYYPSRDRTFGSTAGKWGQSIGIDAATFMFKEFWPDINHYVFHASKGPQQ